jgi:sulfatase modifying factor 1
VIHSLFDEVGNVWEWVQDWWTREHSRDHSVDPKGPPFGKEKVKKGGSFLCHRSFCYRYRNVARYATTIDSATQNSGFRCARDNDS